MSWADSGQMRRGGGRGCALTQHSSFLSVLFLLKGAESPISAKLEQEFKKKVHKTQLQNGKTLTQSKKHCVRKSWQLPSHRNSSTSPSLVVSSLDSVLIHWNLSEFTQVPNEKTDHLDPLVPMVCVLAPTKVLLLTTQRGKWMVRAKNTHFSKIPRNCDEWIQASKDCLGRLDVYFGGVSAE